MREFFFRSSVEVVLLTAALVGGCQRGGSGLASEETGGADSSGPTPVTSTGDDAVTLLCEPGEVRCAGQAFLETCAPTGLEWVAEPCPTNNTCVVCEGETCAEDHCTGPCTADTLVPSSAGCSFIANRQLHQSDNVPDSVIVANPNESLVANLKFWATPEGKRKEELVEETTLMPGEDHLFEMANDFVLGTSTMFRTGGTFRVESDVPVIAYQHAPGAANTGNDSSLLLPDNTLGNDYVVVSYSPHEETTFGFPSYFEIVALEDNTRVEWTPPVPTAGNGLPIDPVAAGGTGTQTMNRFDTMRIAASASFPDDFPSDFQDVSGTVIHADKPIWVVGGSRCSRVPVRETPGRGFCDPLQELLIPLEYWGEEYVAPHPPLRFEAMGGEPSVPDAVGERHYWRIYAGAKDGVTLTTDPQVLTPENCPAPNVYSDGSCTLPARGAWIEVVVDHGTNFHISGDGAFLPVGYLQSRHSSGEPPETLARWGDSAMYQVVAPAQFLDRYVIRTAVGYPHHYVQVVRGLGGDNVIVDFQVIGELAWRQIGSSPYEVATIELTEDTHTIFSNSPFGVIQFGYTETGDEHYEGCTFPAREWCAPCPENETEAACNSAEYNNDRTCCSWVEDACIPARLCRSSYAYPGGMKSEPIYIP